MNKIMDELTIIQLQPVPAVGKGKNQTAKTVLSVNYAEKTADIENRSIPQPCLGAENRMRKYIFRKEDIQ